MSYKPLLFAQLALCSQNSTGMQRNSEKIICCQTHSHVTEFIEMTIAYDEEISPKRRKREQFFSAISKDTSKVIDVIWSDTYSLGNC